MFVTQKGQVVYAPSRQVSYNVCHSKRSSWISPNKVKLNITQKDHAVYPTKVFCFDQGQSLRHQWMQLSLTCNAKHHQVLSTWTWLVYCASLLEIFQLQQYSWHWIIFTYFNLPHQPLCESNLWPRHYAVSIFGCYAGCAWWMPPQRLDCHTWIICLSPWTKAQTYAYSLPEQSN